MKLTLDQIRNIAVGIEYADEENGKIRLHRFTKDEEELYRVTNNDFYLKSFATAGVRLEFVTNSSTLSLTTEVSYGSSRKYFEHSIHVNGQKYSSLGARSNSGVFSASIALPEGENAVCIYFPWSTSSDIHGMELEDGATLAPVKKEKKMLIYGDSITHGYDASSPELSYASIIADALNADAKNKGIGAEIFRPALAELNTTPDVDYITVAYGTNDWSACSFEEFESNCRGFYTALSKNHPNAKIFALTPVWRKDWLGSKKMGRLYRVNDFIEKLEAEIPNLKAICGIGFIPADPSYFSPDVLHPNDKGFAPYGAAVLEEIKKHI